MDDRVQKVLGSVLGINKDDVTPKISMSTVKGWDSLKQLTIILALEEEFGISISDGDVSTMTSYQGIRDVLGKYV